MSEVWKEVSVNSNYEISTLGNVKNKKTQCLLKPYISPIGYASVGLSKNNINVRYSLHRLVALTFLPNYYNKSTVNHKNKIRSDNRLWNLEWSTIQEQNIHKNINKIKTTFYMCTMKPIWRIDINTNEKLEKYNNLTEAQDWCIENNLSKAKYIKTGISQVASGKRNYALGYKWEYENKNENDEYKDEIWKQIPDTLICQNKNAFISSFGRIKYENGIIGNGYSFSGYLGISIGGKNYKAHQLVAKVFLPNPYNKLIVNHKDGNKFNAKLDNLEWNTHKENSEHAYSTGLNKNTKPIIQFDLNMNKIKEFNSINEASRELNITSVRISKCCRKLLNSIDDNVFLYKDEYISEQTNGIYKNKKYNNIIQFDLNFNIVKLFKSTSQASKELNIKKSLILSCCNNDQKSTNKFIFMYKNKYNPTIQYKLIKNTKAKKIVQFDLNMNIIKTFESIIKASNELNISDSNISSCCKGNRKTTGGFKFMYFEDYTNTHSLTNAV